MSWVVCFVYVILGNGTEEAEKKTKDQYFQFGDDWTVLTPSVIISENLPFIESCS